MSDQWGHKIFNIKEPGFEALALEIFRFQAQNSPVYSDYLKALQIKPDFVSSIERIPFLPIRFFKSHSIQATSFVPQVVFESSGTTGSINSRHLVKDVSLYEESFIKSFELFYGPIKNLCVIGLLPSYLERNNSSLVYMVNKLIALSQHPQSGFYLNEFEKLSGVLNDLKKAQQKTLLIGVTFALLDFAEQYAQPLPNITIMETGGMKGRREEMIRPEVHQQLKGAFNLSVIHSEYGMTELLSQAYSNGNGIFNCPPWMKILIRDDEDPFLIKKTGNGILNVIDLANIYSCSFIATEDVGNLFADASFQVLGRIDGSDLRGCSLMVV